MTVTTYQFGVDAKSAEPAPTSPAAPKTAPSSIAIGGSRILQSDGSLASTQASVQMAHGSNGEEGVLATARRNCRPIPAGAMLPSDRVTIDGIEMTVESAQLAGYLKKMIPKATI